MRFIHATHPHDIETFTRSRLNNAWINPAPHLNAYVRKGRHLQPVTADVLNTFDIANVRVDGDKQCNGIFSKWLREVMMEAPLLGYEAIHIENVLTDRFAAHFRRDPDRWIEKSHTEPCCSPSFFLLLRRVGANQA